jgi:hypothetical protein
MVLTLDDGDVRLPTAFAHGLQPVASLRSLEFVKQRRHQSRTCGTERMAESDGTAIHVHPGEVCVDLLLPRKHHGGEGFVDLDQVDVRKLHARLFERPGGRRNRRREHPHGIGSAYRKVMDACPRFQPEARDCLF